MAAGGKQDHPAGAHDLLQVDFEPDHEQHEDQAEFGDDADRFLGLDPAHAEWTNEKPGDKVGEDQRLPGKMGQQAKHPGEQDAKSDIANELVHISGIFLRRNLEARARRSNEQCVTSACAAFFCAILACLSMLRCPGAQAQTAGSIEQNFAGSLTAVPAENLTVSGAFYVPVYSSVSMSQGKLRGGFFGHAQRP